MSVLEGRLSPWEVHRQFIAESLENWTDYMAYLEEKMREQVRCLWQNSGLITLILRSVKVGQNSFCDSWNGEGESIAIDGFQYQFYRSPDLEDFGRFSNRSPNHSPYPFEHYCRNSRPVPEMQKMGHGRREGKHSSVYDR
jgi:hypothetical protein